MTDVTFYWQMPAVHLIRDLVVWLSEDGFSWFGEGYRAVDLEYKRLQYGTVVLPANWFIVGA